MEAGQVKFFDNVKGFGFIRANGVDQDVFVHFSAIVMKGRRTLLAGQRVDFEMVRGDKGLYAKNVVPGETCPVQTEQGA
jgi:CspA family cold shock protein